MTLPIHFTWERGAAMLYWLSDLADSSRHLKRYFFEISPSWQKGSLMYPWLGIVI
jgi:hypothetical protein